MPLAFRWQPQFDALEVREGDRLVASQHVTMKRCDPTEVIAEVADGSVVHLAEVTMPWRTNAPLDWGCTCFAENPCRHAWAALVALDDRLAAIRKRTAGSEASPVPAPARRKPWQVQLQRIRDNTRAFEVREGDAVASRAGRQRELWYLLDISRCFEQGSLVVQFYQREKRQTGAWGKFKSLNLTRDVQQELEQADREITTLLLGVVTPSSDYYHGYGYSYAPYRCERVILPASAYEALLPRMCATGRLVWILDQQLPLDEARSLSYDAGPPYRFRIRSEWRDRKWILRGEFHRGEERIPAENPVLVMGDGVLVMPDRIARLELDHAFGWVSELRRVGEMVIPQRQQQAFLRDVLALSHLPEIELPPQLAKQPSAQRPLPRACFREPERRGSQRIVPGSIEFDYQGRRFPYGSGPSGCLGEDGTTVVLRDHALEDQYVSQLGELDTLALEKSGQLLIAAEQFSPVIEQLIARGWIVEAAGSQVRRAGGMTLQVRSQIDWFALEGEVQFDDQVVTVPQLLEAIRKREDFVRLGDGSRGLLPEQWLERFGVLADLSATADEQEEGADGVRFARCQALLLDALLAESQFQADAGFAELRERLTQGASAEPAEAPKTFQGELRPYQREGVGWLQMLGQLRLGGCLADDMGLGKTIQILALLEQRRIEPAPPDGSADDVDSQRRPSIVVVPKSLVFNWIDEASRFTPELRVLNYTGLGRTSQSESLQDWDVIVTTYGTLRRDILRLKDIDFDYAILDEAQAIKNAQSQSAKATRLLKARQRLALTGTPVENHLGELWSLFEFLNPGMLGRATAFQRLTRRGCDEEQELKKLARGLRPFLLRRTKQQVLTELPQKTEQTLYCELSKKERKQYDELREFYRGKLMGHVKSAGLAKAKIHVLEALLRLRQAACHPGLLDKQQASQPSAKLETLLEQLAEIIAEGHKALVFSQFTSLLSIVRSHLDARGIRYEYLDGRTRQRKACVERFQTDPECPLFLISLKAGGHGLNLTAADYVFVLDPWWNPAVEAQAIDRAHRIGQQRHVFAYRLISRDTVEEKILELQRDKRELAEAIISEDNSVLRNLTEEDLELLFS